MGDWRPQRLIPALGAWMLALGLGLASSGWPERVRPHPYWVASLIVLGILLVIVPTFHSSIQWMRSRLLKVEVLAPPLEIIFEPLNPARRFWELLTPLDDYKRVMPARWEHRVAIQNNSRVTLRNVTVMIEFADPYPQAPYKAIFSRMKSESCDINPGCYEMAIVATMKHPRTGIGSLAGDSAWGEVRVIASADDTAPTERVFRFNPHFDQVFF